MPGVPRRTSRMHLTSATLCTYFSIWPFRVFLITDAISVAIPKATFRAQRDGSLPAPPWCVDPRLCSITGQQSAGAARASPRRGFSCRDNSGWRVPIAVGSAPLLSCAEETTRAQQISARCLGPPGGRLSTTNSIQRRFDLFSGSLRAPAARGEQRVQLRAARHHEAERWGCASQRAA